MATEGMSFPMKLDGRGRIEASTDAQKVRESILLILGTRRGERLMRPDFGSRLATLVFEPNTATTANLARFYVEEALGTWEPRIRLDAVTVRNLVAPRDGEPAGAPGPALAIDIQYTLIRDGEAGELSFLLPLA